MHQNSKLKRIVPLILAAVIIAGTMFGLLASVMAYAVGVEDTTPDSNIGYMRLVSITLYEGDDYDIRVKNVKKGQHYLMRLNLELTDKAVDTGKFTKAYLEDYIRVKLIENENYAVTATDDDFAESARFSYTGSLGTTGNPRHSFSLKVMARKNAATTATFKVEYPNTDGGETGEKDDFDERNISGLDDPYDTSSGGYYYDWGNDSGGSGGSSSSEAEVITTPKIIVTNFEAPKVVKPDEEFQVTFEFMNNSKIKNLENVSMTVAPPEGAAIRNNTNKRYYITIPRRQKSRETFTFKASKDLKLESIPITVKFEYQYELDNAYKDGTNEEILTISAIPKEEEEKDDNGTEGSISSFEILSVVPPDNMFPGEDGYVTVKVINKDHQYDASNVQLTITGDKLVNNGNTEYHGALAHSSQAEIEMAIQFTEPGTYTLEALVTYEDAEGKDKDGKPIVRINDIKKEFTVTVQEMPQQPGMDGMGGMGMDGVMIGEDGLPVDAGMEAQAPWYKNPVILGCAGGGALVLVIIIIIVVKKIRAKKAGDDDEDI